MEKYFAVSEYAVKRFVPEEYHFALTEMEPDVAARYHDVTVSELAKALGMTSFDTALPVDWVRQFQDQTGFYPVGHIVMDYSDNSLGIPKPITVEGKIAYKIFLHVNNIDLG